MKIAEIHTVQMLGHIVIEPGTIVEVLDKNQISEDNHQDILKIKDDDNYIWVKCSAIDGGRSFTVPANRVSIIEDPGQIRLYEVLFG